MALTTNQLLGYGTGGPQNSITNPIPSGIVSLSGPLTGLFQNSDVSWDWAIGGIPFLSGQSLRGTYFRREYLRDFADIRKDQFDSQQQVGEQSILGWWLASQSNFYGGAGSQFLDTIVDTSLRYRTWYTEHLDLFTVPGQTQLLQTTKNVYPTSNTNVQVLGVNLFGTDYVLLCDGTQVRLVNSSGATVNLATASSTVLSIATDGVNYFYATSTGIWEGALSGGSASQLWTYPSTQNVTISFCKGRLMAGINNSVYSLTSVQNAFNPPASTATPLPIGSVTSTSTLDLSVQLSWPSSSDPTVYAYNVYNGSTRYMTVYQPSCDVLGLTKTTQYSFYVTCVNTTGESPRSGVFTVTTQNTTGSSIPSAPTAVTIGSVTGTTIAVSWTAGSTGTDSWYNVYANGVLLGQSTSTSTVLTGLTPGLTYKIQVTGVNGTTTNAGNAYGEGPASAIVSQATTTIAALPAPNFTHPTSNFTWVGFTGTPVAIFAAGNAGALGQIYEFALTTGGTLPVLSGGIVAAELPVGENINAIYGYLGQYIGMATSKGMRVGVVTNSTITANLVNLNYGPLVVQTTNGSQCVTGYDRFLFFGNTDNNATNYVPQVPNGVTLSSTSGLTRVDLSQTLPNGLNPFCNDLDAHVQGNVTSATMFGASAGGVSYNYMMAFMVQGHGVYLTDTSNKEPQGFMITPKIRYNTLEPKHFKYIYLRTPVWSDGAMSINALDPGGGFTDVIQYASSSPSATPILLGVEGNQQEWMSFQIVFNRGTTSTNNTPIMYGYQLRSLPGVDRQMLLTIPLMCNDLVRDKYGNTAGYDGFGFARRTALETMLRSGNVVAVQDLNYNTTYLCVVEALHYEQQANMQPKAATNGGQDSNAEGGYTTVQLRTVV